MGYIYRDGKVIDAPTDIKFSKKFIKAVDDNEKAKQFVKEAIETVKKAKVKYEF